MLRTRNASAYAFRSARDVGVLPKFAYRVACLLTRSAAPLRVCPSTPRSRSKYHTHATFAQVAHVIYSGLPARPERTSRRSPQTAGLFGRPPAAYAMPCLITAIKRQPELSTLLPPPSAMPPAVAAFSALSSRHARSLRHTADFSWRRFCQLHAQKRAAMPPFPMLAQDTAPYTYRVFATRRVAHADAMPGATPLPQFECIRLPPAFRYRLLSAGRCHIPAASAMRRD